MIFFVLHDFELDEGCYKVRLLLRALSLPFEARAVNMIPGAEQTKPPLLDLNPRGTLPILEEHAGARTIVLCEAEAILAHLAQHHDPSRRWLPAEPDRFGAVMSWLVFAARDLRAAVVARRASLFGEPRDQEGHVAAARAALRAMEDHMALRRIDGEAWFVGEAPTIADIALWPSFALSRDYRVEPDAFPSLRAWARNVRRLPGFTTMPGIPDFI